MKPWAFNQGFYNLFLAIGTAVGIAISNSNRDAGLALVLLGVGSMLAAAVVLISSDREQRTRGGGAGDVPGDLPAAAGDLGLGVTRPSPRRRRCPPRTRRGGADDHAGDRLRRLDAQWSIVCAASTVGLGVR